MEASPCRLLISQPNFFSQPKILCRPNRLPPSVTLKASPARRFRHFRQPAAVKCARRGSVPELEEEEEEEEERGGEGKEELGLGEDLGVKGVVELMECLEQEAIMGEDEGRDPTDYNRRAEIFDKSYRVFRALRAQHPPSDDHHQHQC